MPVPGSAVNAPPKLLKIIGVEIGENRIALPTKILGLYSLGFFVPFNGRTELKRQMSCPFHFSPPPPPPPPPYPYLPRPFPVRLTPESGQRCRPHTTQISLALRPLRSKVTFGVFVWDGSSSLSVGVLIGTISHDLALPSSHPTRVISALRVNAMAA